MMSLSRRKTYLSIVMHECDPHLRLPRNSPSAVMLSSPFKGVRFERRAVAGAIMATRLPTLIMEHFNGADEKSALEWTQNAIK